MILKLHRAYKVIGFTQKEMPNGWPQAFSLEHIAKLQFSESVSDESIFFRALKADCTNGSLKHIATIELRQHKLSASVQHHIYEVIRHELRDNSYEVTVHYVDHRDLAVWLEKQGEKPSAHLAAWLKAITSDTPAPPEVSVPIPVPGDVEPDKAGPKDKRWVMKKAALIDKHVCEWATIKSDFHSASENGLSKAAKAPGHGEWFEADALYWADQRGKLKKEKEAGPASLTTVWTSKKHTI